MSNIIGGLIAIVLGLWGMLVWWEDFGELMRGLVPFALIVLGLLSLASKYNNKKKKEQTG
ncbi:hypothetical protein ACFL4Z_01395 [candidate division KSB1 bacterium]